MNYTDSLANMPDILTPQMIAALLDIGYSKALDLVKSDQFPCLKIGNCYKVPKFSFCDWLNAPGFRKVL